MSERESCGRRRVGALARVVADDERRRRLGRRCDRVQVLVLRRGDRALRVRADRAERLVAVEVEPAADPGGDDEDREHDPAEDAPDRAARRARRRRRLPVPAHRLEHRAAGAPRGRCRSGSQRDPCLSSASSACGKRSATGRPGHLTEVPGRAPLPRPGRGRDRPRARRRGSAAASARPRRTAGPCAPRSPRPGRGRPGRRRSTAPAGARDRCR